MNIKCENGMVTFVMRTGKDFVQSQMPLGSALAIQRNGKEIEETDKRGCGKEICVDDTYFFPIEPEKPVKTTKKAEV